MIYVFDLDKTLCTYCFEEGIAAAQPLKERIEKVNKLYDEGHTIIIDTARGSITGLNWNELTKKQLMEWGVKYHQVRAGVKFYADVYCDDKGIKDTDFFK